MPANPKYLTPHFWSRFAKISASILGGLLVSVTLHMALASWFNRAAVVITSTFSAFLVWVILMIVAFLAKNGWKIWALYLILGLGFMGLTLLGNNIRPLR